MRRREFVAMLGGAAVAWPLSARAQQTAMPIVGFLSAGDETTYPPFLAAFRAGLSDEGYAEDRNVAIEYRFAKGQLDRLPAFATDLLGRGAAVIVTTSGPAPALAVKSATATLPIVFLTGSAPDPVQLGLIQSLNRPGGNTTGVLNFLGDLEAKSLQLLTEIVPKDVIFAAMVNPKGPSAKYETANIEAASRALGRPVVIVPVTTEGELESAFASLTERKVGGLLVDADPLFFTNREHVVTQAARQRVPTIYAYTEFAELGALMTYGNDLADLYRQVGLYAGRILHGEKPADLPVIRASLFKLTINLKVATSLGLTIPPTLLATADEVIE